VTKQNICWREQPTISLLQMLGTFGLVLQKQLFVALEEELGPLSRHHEQFVAALALLELESAVGAQQGRGRRRHDRAKIARAFVAKAIFDLPTTRALLDRFGLRPPVAAFVRLGDGKVSAG
jgi:hypothetical protein